MKRTIITALTILIPTVAFAQTTPIRDVNSLAAKLIDIGNLFTYILMAVAVIFIIWNVVRYMIIEEGDDRKSALKNFTWGIVGLFLIISLWGFVNLLLNTFRTTPPNMTIPQIQNVDYKQIISR